VHEACLLICANIIGSSQFHFMGLGTDWAQYYSLKRECQCQCRRAYNNYVMSLVDDNNNVSKTMWTYCMLNQKKLTTLELNH